MAHAAEMSAASLMALVELLDGARIEHWLDGGWGVDALLQRQTRPHKDVDLIVRVADVPALVELLGARGFAIREGSLPHSFVLADGSGLEVDIHAVTFDEEGNGIYQMQNGQIWTYPAEGFVGHGVIGGREARCLSPAVQVLCHAHGYTPAEKDFQEMRLLEESFGVELPPQLKRGSG